jgi:zinc D-Ala-D-Ala dipeptidase
VLLLCDPAIASVPVLDCGEPLVDCRRHDDLLVDTRKQDAAGAWAHLRAGVLDRVLAAQEALPQGVRLLVVEGHRPHALQQAYFQDQREDLRRAHPSGAAVDLILSAEGRELDLGTPVNATREDSRGGCSTASPDIGDQARHRRQVLAAALSAAGLVNHPPEWWHWSYGDRCWASATGAPHALYAPVQTAARPVVDARVVPAGTGGLSAEGPIAALGARAGATVALVAVDGTDSEGPVVDHVCWLVPEAEHAHVADRAVALRGDVGPRGAGCGSTRPGSVRLGGPRPGPEGRG